MAIGSLPWFDPGAFLIDGEEASPLFVAPMQASSVKEPFDSPDWIFETKAGPVSSDRVWKRHGV
jgi:hypothetical protein